MRYTALHCLPKPGRILHPSHWRCEQKNLRPLESIAETQPQLQRALLKLSAMISQHFVNAEGNPSLAGPWSPEVYVAPPGRAAVKVPLDSVVGITLINLDGAIVVG